MKVTVDKFDKSEWKHGEREGIASEGFSFMMMKRFYVQWSDISLFINSALIKKKKKKQIYTALEVWEPFGSRFLAGTQALFSVRPCYQHNVDHLSVHIYV